MSLMITAVRIECERLWNRVKAALQERRSGFSDREAGDFIGVLDATYGRLTAVPDEPPTAFCACSHWWHPGNVCAACGCSESRLSSAAIPPAAVGSASSPHPPGDGAGHPNVLPALLSNAALAVELWLGGDRPSNPKAWRRLAVDLHAASRDLLNK